MFKKHLKTSFALLSFILLTLIIVSTAFSGTLFGPKKYQRTYGSQNTYTDTFQATGNTGTIIVKNGDANGDNRVTSVSIYLNGKEIFDHEDFEHRDHDRDRDDRDRNDHDRDDRYKNDRHRIYKLEKSVALKNGTNTIKVILAGKPGSYITIEVTGNAIAPPTVSMNANPASIANGSSSILSWTTNNANTCSIDHGIGNVPVNGNITVNPTQTATYTITATGTGGAITKAVTVTVVLPPALPTVNITANPQNISPGASSTLTWNSTNATSCSIDQGIGTVAVNGTITVNPTQTTTYTITTTGQGGSVTASTTVTVVPPPTVTLNATPAAITKGQSSTLSWTSTDATTCSINQGIGTVATNGSVAVAPAQTTTYTIIATGPSGTTQAAITVTVSTVSKIDLAITSPADGAFVTGSSVMVTGTVNNSSGHETGVTVNGVIAAVINNQFAVNSVPLAAGQNTITVTATDTIGKTATQTITVNANPPLNYIKLSANNDSGISPLVVTLTINGTFSVTNPVITATGPGTVEQLVSTNAGEYTYQLNAEGVYCFTAQANSPDNNTYQDTIAIMVLPIAQIDAFLQAKWILMNNALQSGNTGAALNLIHVSKRSNYQTMFNVLQNQLPAIVATQTGLVLNSMISANTAWYDLTTAESGGNFVYRVVFVKDTKGLWCILGF